MQLEVAIAKIRNVLTFHSWLNLAMEDRSFKLDCICNSAEEIVKPGTRFANPQENWQREKSTNFEASRSLPESFLVDLSYT